MKMQKTISLYVTLESDSIRTEVFQIVKIVCYCIWVAQNVREKQYFDRDTDTCTNQWKIFTEYSRRVDVLLYILQNTTSRIQGNVITFLRTLWIWHWRSFGQHWTVVGAPWTTHSLLPRARSVQCPLAETLSVGRGRHRQWPPLILWISIVSRTCLCCEEKKRQGTSLKLMRTNLRFEISRCLSCITCQPPLLGQGLKFACFERGMICNIILWSHQTVKVPTFVWPLEQKKIDLRELFIWKRAHCQSVNGFYNLWMPAVFWHGLCVVYGNWGGEREGPVWTHCGFWGALRVRLTFAKLPWRPL